MATATDPAITREQLITGLNDDLASEYQRSSPT